MNLLKRNRANEWLLFAVVAAMAAGTRFWLLKDRWFDFFRAEETMSQALFGLMGLHILQGHPMVYFYGQGHMGSLEAFTAAVYFLIHGVSITSLQLSPLTYFLLFIVTNFFLLKKVYGLETSFIANAFLAVSPPFLTQISFSAWGGYNQILFFGSLTLLLLVSYRERPAAWKFFAAGLAAGIGFWTHNLVMTFFMALAAYLLLTSELLRRNSGPGRWKRLLLLENFGLPVYLRVAGIALHAYLLFWLAMNLASFFAGMERLSVAGHSLKLPFPPFKVKYLKKAVLAVSIEILALVFMTKGGRRMLAWLKKTAPLWIGFAIGYTPIVIYSIVDDSGYRQLHGSAVIPIERFPEQWDSVVNRELLGRLLALQPGFYADAALFAFLAGVYIFAFRREIGMAIRARGDDYTPAVFPFVMTLIAFGVCFFNELGGTAARYLTPLYFSLSLIFAMAVVHLRKRVGPSAYLLLILLLANNVYANARWLNTRIPEASANKAAAEEVVRTLREKGVKGAYAHSDDGLPMTLIAQEKLIFAPYRSINRYPRYNQMVDEIPDGKIAYVFNQQSLHEKQFVESIEKAGISSEHLTIGHYDVYVIDRGIRSEKGIVPPADAAD